MADSGSFQNAIRTGYTLRVEWETTSQSVANNTSTVQVRAYLVSGGSSYTISSSATKEVRLTINGTTYSKSEAGLASLSGNQKKLLFSKSVTVTHASNGAKSIEISCAFDIEVTLSGTYYGTVRAPASGSATATLDTIPRATTPTTSGTFNVGSAVTINLDRASSAFTHTVQYSLNNSTWTNISTNVGTSVSWTLPSALASAKTTAASGTVYIRAITYNGSSNIGNKVISRTYYITSSYAAPTVALAASQTNAGSVAQYIRGKSSVTLKATATLKYSASAKTYVFTYGGTKKTVTTSSSTASVTFSLPTSAAASYACSVELTDTRGFKDTASSTLTTVAYTAPRITALTATRGNYNGTTFTVDSKGKSVRVQATGTVTSLSNANKKTYTIEHRLYDATEYTALVTNATASAYSVSVTYYTSAIFSENAAYVLRFSLSDSFETVSNIADIPSQRVMMNFSADGTAMCIGGIATPGVPLNVAYPLLATGGLPAQVLPDGTDLNEIMKTGTYTGTVTASTAVNSPLTSGTYTLEVTDAGPAGQIMQRYSYCSKTSYRAFVRFYYQSAWGAWQPAEGFLNSNGSTHTGQVRLANGFLLQWGRVDMTPTAANTVTTSTVNFPVAYDFIPMVVASARTTVPQNLQVSAVSDETSVTIYLVRNSTSQTSVSWLAIGVAT